MSGVGWLRSRYVLYDAGRFSNILYDPLLYRNILYSTVYHTVITADV